MTAMTTMTTIDRTTNPCGLRGLAFLELAAPDPSAIHRMLLAFGFSRTMRHAHRPVDLYEQGAIRLLLDRSAARSAGDDRSAARSAGDDRSAARSAGDDRGRSGFAAQFTAAHGPSTSSIRATPGPASGSCPWIERIASRPRGSSRSIT
ncbi:MAG: 4-hydroxyphenylpyruvate dioxygenase [Deltaproteobacteria bacterium]|nr:4-hydroxyphenylpyruvate dioxygenase [Deltaproteobacteria bacterium]